MFCESKSLSYCTVIESQVSHDQHFGVNVLRVSDCSAFITMLPGVFLLMSQQASQWLVVLNLKVLDDVNCPSSYRPDS